MKTNEETNEYPQRRRYDEDVKTSALKMVEEGQSVSDVSRALGIPKHVLYRWKSTLGKMSSPTDELQTELEHLKRQLRQVEQERDILEKALSFFGPKT